MFCFLTELVDVDDDAAELAAWAGLAAVVARHRLRGCWAPCRASRRAACIINDDGNERFL